MNERKTIVTVAKAVILADVTGCSVDDAIRYVAATLTTKESDLVAMSLLTGVSTTKLKMLKAADTSMAIF